MPGNASNFRYEIHPALGVARVGNAPTPQKDWKTSSEPNIFYLDPVTIGGLPHECDVYGNPVRDNITPGQTPKEVQTFKSPDDLVRRQAAFFKVYRYDATNPDDPGVEVNLATEVRRFKWTVHIANKKAAWYEFALLKGNLLLGENNSYAGMKVDLRNT
jgi:L-lysine 6-oxidase